MKIVKLTLVPFLVAFIMLICPMNKSAQATDLDRFEATGQIHVLGENENTTTPGYFDNSEEPVVSRGLRYTTVISTGPSLLTLRRSLFVRA